MSILGR